MASRQPATADSDNEIDEARSRYTAALRGFAQSAAGGLRDAVHTALYPLNAVYYLRDLLPADVHRAAVSAAAGRLIAGAAAVPAANGEPAPVRTAPLRTLLRLAGTRAAAGTAATLLQHALEIEPLLSGQEIRTVRAALRDRLLAMPAAADERRRLRAGARGGLGVWAACNARPPRDGEVAAWAACLGQRPAIELAEQALAGGLRFEALLDALSLAAARRLQLWPSEQTAAGLIAAHAVRRLTEIGQTPALAAWLGVSGELAPLHGAPSCGPEAAPAAAALALSAVRSGDPLLIQTAEAAVMEAEALPVALRHLPLLALARLLEAAQGGREAQAPVKRYAAADAAGG